VPQAVVPRHRIREVVKMLHRLLTFSVIASGNPPEKFFMPGTVLDPCSMPVSSFRFCQGNLAFYFAVLVFIQVIHCRKRIGSWKGKAEALTNRSCTTRKERPDCGGAVLYKKSSHKKFPVVVRIE
jgi:hypothetical protein